ncbi:MAG: dihydroorotate dehydrogenase electron transfer subunit [Actinomycetes bacterium]
MSPTLHHGSRTVFGRDGDGPVITTCEVLQRRREGAYHSLVLSSPDIAERARPGQFVNIAVEGAGTLLRRPFSIARVGRTGPNAGTIEVVFDAHGPGTEWLARRTSHDTLDVVGPLGSSFPIPQQKVSCLLVGGGYGVAPLFFLGEELTRAGLRVDMIVGAATAERIHNAIEAKRMTASVTFTTEDGTLGTRGRVTDVLDDVISSCNSGVVYACGPNPMLRAVSERCRELEVPVQVAVEEHMACGVGVCWTCVLPMRGKDGAVRNKRACIDGPVFNGARVAWTESRWDLGPPVDDEEDDEPETPRRPTDEELFG